MPDPTQTLSVELAAIPAILKAMSLAEKDAMQLTSAEEDACLEFEDKLRDALSSSPEQGGETGDCWVIFKNDLGNGVESGPDIEPEKQGLSGAEWAKAAKVRVMRVLDHQRYALRVSAWIADLEARVAQPPTPALSDEEREWCERIAHRLEVLGLRQSESLIKRRYEDEAAFLRTLAPQEQGEEADETLRHIDLDRHDLRSGARNIRQPEHLEQDCYSCGEVNAEEKCPESNHDFEVPVLRCGGEPGNPNVINRGLASQMCAGCPDCQPPEHLERPEVPGEESAKRKLAALDSLEDDDG